MIDVTERLAQMQVEVTAVDDGTVRHDLERGRAALTRRRVRRGLTAAGATFAMTAAAVVTLHGASDSTPRNQQAIGSSQPPAASAALRLVAYNGKQLPGFTVSRVPEGYVLQGATATSLDIARADDRTPVDAFVGKLVVMLQSVDATNLSSGTRVSVNGRPGAIRTDGSGVRTLQYSDGTHDIQIQAWSNITLTDAQLVSFAEGVTVTSNAVAPRG